MDMFTPTYTQPELEELFRKWCGYALMAEVSATPKPGLVDLHDNGAHTDMNYDTFAASTGAIVPWLVKMAAAGFAWEQAPEEGLFAAIRPLGMEAERAMFAATGGVNTHKGMIFSMGIVAAAGGWYLRAHERFDPERVLLLCGEMCRELLEQDFQSIDLSHPKTHGEILYARYGARGIRGEVQQGFPSIRTVSLPALRRLKNQGYEDNAAYLDTLLALMAQVDDTNVLIRTSPALLAYEKQEAARILELGGAGTEEGLEALRRLNLDFIVRNISPGGCADLLAVTILLYQLELAIKVPGTPAAHFPKRQPQSPRW